MHLDSTLIIVQRIYVSICLFNQNLLRKLSLVIPSYSYIKTLNIFLNFELVTSTVILSRIYTPISLYHCKIDTISCNDMFINYQKQHLEIPLIPKFYSPIKEKLQTTLISFLAQNMIENSLLMLQVL